MKGLFERSNNARNTSVCIFRTSPTTTQYTILYDEEQLKEVAKSTYRMIFGSKFLAFFDSVFYHRSQ